MLQRLFIFLLRVSLGWMFFWAGYTKIIDPKWSALSYITTAKNFPELYKWFASPQILPVTNFLNEWGLILIGIALILGVCMRLSAFFGTILMLLYYFVILQFPYPNPHSYIVDEHIIYIFALLVLNAIHAGRIFGLGNWVENSSLAYRFPRLKKFFI